MRYVLRGNLDDAIEILRSLGANSVVSDVISNYVDIHRGQIHSVDESGDVFHRVVKDTEFREALEAALTPLTQKPVKEVLTGLYEGKLSRENLEIACALSTDDLYALFKDLNGETLYPVVRGSLTFQGVSNATEPQKALTQHALEALERIGCESPVNTIRVKKFGVMIAEAVPPNRKESPLPLPNTR
jgi:hypothetical protein